MPHIRARNDSDVFVAQRIATLFTSGINAYVALTEADPGLAGPEFAEAGFAPGRWSPGDLCRIRSHGLYGNVEQELDRAVTLHRLGPGAEDLRSARDPHAPLTVPEGLDLGVLHDGILRDYRLVCAPVDLGAGAPDPVTGTAHTSAEPGAEGSNDGVIGPGRTDRGSGGPLQDRAGGVRRGAAGNPGPTGAGPVGAAGQEGAGPGRSPGPAPSCRTPAGQPAFGTTTARPATSPDSSFRYASRASSMPNRSTSGRICPARYMSTTSHRSSTVPQ